jgi:hypothetical protein
MPQGCEINSWIYEHVRQFVIELNQYVSYVKPQCLAKTCPLMNVSNENYRCIVHTEPRDVSLL